METRANFILIGLFTLLAILGTLGFFIWLARVQIDQQYATYGILFEDVSGLDASGDVLFNGISVGRVIDLRIYEKDPSKVFTTVEISATTPIKSNTVAQLQSQGVTGVAYISLSGGTVDAGPLVAKDGGLPIIGSKRSTLQTLVQDGPDLLSEATQLLDQFKALTGPENQAYVTNILRNLDASSGQLDQALEDFSQITRNVGDASAEIAVFTNKLDAISGAVTNTLTNADRALISAQEAFDVASTTMGTTSTAIAAAEGAFVEAENLMKTQVPSLVAQVTDTISQTHQSIADLTERSAKVIDDFDQTALLLNARLAELEQPLKNANAAFVAVIEASESFDTLVSGSGTELVAEARDVLADAKITIATIEDVVINDVPAVVTDIRKAVTTASAAVEAVAQDVTGFTGKLEPLTTATQEGVEAATALLQRAQTSLDILDSAFAGAETTLTSAQTAFDAATDLMDTDLGPVLNDIRTASERVSVAVEDVTRDVPAIATDLRNLIARADAVVVQVQRTVAASAPGIGEFSSRGLPELTRLSAEARALVTSLGSLVRRIDQNPTGFILDNRVPDYRR